MTLMRARERLFMLKPEVVSGNAGGASGQKDGSGRSRWGMF